MLQRKDGLSLPQTLQLLGDGDDVRSVTQLFEKVIG